jgi:U6 snRNA-associated Sm-like protein LSm7
LKGYDKLDNLVLDDCIEFIRGRFWSTKSLHCFRYVADYQRTLMTAIFDENSDPTDPFKLSDKTRRLGLVVCRGTHVSLISPADGMEEISNPFGDDFADDEAAS